MTGFPTNRGYVVIQQEAGGTSTVFVAGSISSAGRPAEVSAVHTGVARLVVGSEVALAGKQAHRWSRRLVDVFDDGQGAVHIQGPWAHARSLDKFIPDAGRERHDWRGVLLSDWWATNLS